MCASPVLLSSARQESNQQIRMHEWRFLQCPCHDHVPVQMIEMTIRLGFIRIRMSSHKVARSISIASKGLHFN